MKEYSGKKVQTVKVPHNDPLFYQSKNYQVAARSRTWGSSTWSWRRLSTPITILILFWIKHNSTRWSILGSNGKTKSDCSLFLWLLSECSLNQTITFSLKWRQVKGQVEVEGLFDDSLNAWEYQLHVLTVQDRAEEAGGSFLFLRYILRG